MKHSGTLVILGLALAFASGCSRSTVDAAPDNSPTVGVTPVLRQDLAHDLVLAAEFRPFQEVDLHAKVAGYVKEMKVDVGDHVKQGELLAVLEIPELQDELRQADAAVRRSAAELKRSQAELQRAQSSHSVAHVGYTRLAQVAQNRPTLIAQQELDDAQGKDRVAEAQVATAEAAVAAAQEQLSEAQADHAKLQTLFSYARIVAPFDGVITKRYADTGSMIQAGTASQTQTMPVVRVSQNDKLRLVIPVPESVVAQIRIGSPVQVKVPTLKTTLSGQVTRFADSVDLDTRTMQTEIDVPNPHLQLMPGMYAEATIVLEKKSGVLVVPVQALDRQEQQTSVMVVTPDGKLERREVQVGMDTPTAVEVTGGLQPDDLVVVSSRGQLRAGEHVRTKRVETSAHTRES